MFSPHLIITNKICRVYFQKNTLKNSKTHVKLLRVVNLRNLKVWIMLISFLIRILMSTKSYYKVYHISRCIYSIRFKSILFVYCIRLSDRQSKIQRYRCLIKPLLHFNEISVIVKHETWNIQLGYDLLNVLYLYY